MAPLPRAASPAQPSSWGHPWGAGGTAWGPPGTAQRGERGAQCHPGEPRAPQQGVCLPPPAHVCVWAPVLRERAWPCAPAAARGVAVAQAPRARSLNNSAHRSASCCKCSWPRAGRGTLLPDRGTSLSPSLSSSPSLAGALHGVGEPPEATPRTGGAGLLERGRARQRCAQQCWLGSTGLSHS